MKRLLPLCVVLVALNSWCQTLESNVRTALSRLDLNGKVDVVSHGRHVYLRSQSGEDIVRQWIDSHRAEIKRQSPRFARWYHDSGESYRVVARPSLHLTWIADQGVWDAHLDRWCPSFTHPSTLLGHLALEVAWNALTRRGTSQLEIRRLLDRTAPEPTLTAP